MPAYASPLLAATLLATLSFSALGAEVSIGDPYARAVPPGQANSAVFMSLENQTGENQALVGAESVVSEVVELHTHVEEDGMMRMRRIEKIEIPAGETVTLKPGGLHVMLIGLKQPLEPGDTVDLALTFEDGSRIPVQAPVRRIEVPMQRTAH
ncbi:copper chaperone PCu(A)C [Thiocapsa sp.]|uniref:copper chaperone PCu(A)C n=1 Tax=Thiocapsa sp. TaxID=2024551 RepID=UPI002BB9897D|nr:copper chaperone PCu(A)C [Thiocapsa sp.]HSO84788.1 copper chaperone PCu(A)C [Thiocapsa sp.]